MQLNPSEISELIKSKIQNLQGASEVRTQGTVVSVTDGICRVHGLQDVMQGEMLEFPGNTFGMALNLERDSVGAVVLGAYEHISEGDIVKTTGHILEVPVGHELLGRVVNTLGQPIDGKGPINAKQTDKLEKVAPGVIWRKSVSQPVQTGLKCVDAMVPVGRGQRELIIGDRQNKRLLIVKFPCCYAVRQAVKPIRVTFSIFTHAFWSAQLVYLKNGLRKLPTARSKVKQVH